MPRSALLATPRRGARIVSFGAASASEVITGAALVAPFGKDAAWLRERSGIETVRRLGPAETIEDLAETASRAAIQSAGPIDPDLILVATCSRFTGRESTFASELASRLGISAMGADLNAACSGFVYGLSCAADQVRMGAAESVLVVGAEHMSSLIDPSDLGTSVLFGDGAGAAVVQACDLDADGFGPTEWYSDGASAALLHIPAGSHTLHMDGRAVFRWAVSTVPQLIERALSRANVKADEIEVFVPHQANLRIIEPVRRLAGLMHAPMADDVRGTGNTSAASIPLAIAELGTRIDIRNKLALIVGFGAGLSAAAQVVRLP